MRTVSGFLSRLGLVRDRYGVAVHHLSKDHWGRSGQAAWDKLVELAGKIPSPRVLELGVLPSIPGRSTTHRRLVPHASEFVGTDIQPGDEVDFVADVHRLSETTGEEAYDVIISESCFEHFKYPHLAAHQIMKTLRVGGIVLAQTHQSFPIHGYPHDYFRFTTEAMRSLFGEKMGMTIHACGYASPAAIYSRVDPEGYRAPAFLHVNVCAEKVATTPNEYVYEFDCLTHPTPG